MQYEYTKFQKLAIKWLIAFSFVCFLNSILTITFQVFGESEIALALVFSLPFFHAFIIVLCYLLYFLKCRMYGGGEYLNYIRDNYPEIWAKVWCKDSVNPVVYNTFALSAFLKDKYDNGSDETLNKIKLRIKASSNLMAAPLALTAVVWIFNILLLFLAGKFIS